MPGMHVCTCQFLSISAQAVLGLLHKELPQTHVVLMALLPRHRANEKGELTWPNLYTKVHVPAFPIPFYLSRCPTYPSVHLTPSAAATCARRRGLQLLALLK
jgi:hypothetical protein